MTSIFARQFGASAPYDPTGLDTGVLAVGGNLPRKPPRKKNPSEEETNSSTGGNSGPRGVSGSASNSVSSSASARAVAKAQQDAAVNASVAKRMRLDAQGEGLSAVSAAVPASAPVHASAPDSALHWAAHTFDSARHGLASAGDAVNRFSENPVVSGIMHFGDPFSNQEQGGIQILKPAPGTVRHGNNPSSPPYLEPMPSHFGPSRDLSGEIGSSGARSAVSPAQFGSSSSGGWSSDLLRGLESVAEDIPEAVG